MRLLLISFLMLTLYPATTLSAEEPAFINQLRQTGNASLLMEDSNGKKLHQLHINQPLIPASTLKLITAYASLMTWGPEHHFHTDFFLDENNHLFIKGYGDPLLISEELDIIVSSLIKKGLKQINGIHTDTSFFSNQLSIDGQSNTSNPYDASPGALASNFNTLYIRKTPQGLFSAEPQTPLTRLSYQLARSVGNGKHRINLGQQSDGANYFAELIKAKLKANNIPVNGSVSRATIKHDTPLFYRHYNSKNLAEIISGMLEYSNNFIANQLYLMLGAAQKKAPASMQKSRVALNEFIEEEFSWKDYQLREGAGLSRKNSLSAQQLVDVLQKLKPYAHLLPQQNSHISAKTGTLQNVSSYAGYIYNANGLNPFALIINQRVDPQLRFDIAKKLAQLHALK